MLLTFKIRLELTKEQETVLNFISNEGRVLYNSFLSNIREHYEKHNKFISYYEQQKQLKNYKTEYLTFDLKKEILRTLHNNYASFFKLLKHSKSLNPKSPRFRSDKYFFTISFTQDFIINNNIIKLSYSNYRKLELPLLYYKPILNLRCLRNKTKESVIKQMKIYKRGDKYYASIVYEKKEEELKEIDKCNIFSIDLGRKNLLAIYDVGSNSGMVYSSIYLHKNQNYYDKRIDELKSKRDKKKKHSRKYKKLRLKLDKSYSKKRVQTNLVLHKVSKNLSEQGKTILIGELTNLKQNIISDKRRTNRQMQNNWNLMTFIRLLSYKNRIRGNEVIKVNEAWTSKTCCKCGSINYDLELSNRRYICDCGNDINRDINGTINIYKHYMGGYSTPVDVDNISISERFDWCNINQMNRNYRYYKRL